MSAHVARVVWQRAADEAFVAGRYSRGHRWFFDGGLEVPASASPDIVRAPWSDPAAVDPEEAFVASLASCHMLWFLGIAAEQGYTVERYVDDARGTLGRNAARQLAITAVELKPVVAFAGTPVPSIEQFQALHHLAHEKCFLAASVTATITVIPTMSER